MTASGGLRVFDQHRLSPTKAGAKRCSCCYFRLSAKLDMGRLRGLTGNTWVSLLVCRPTSAAEPHLLIPLHLARLEPASIVRWASPLPSLSYSLPGPRSLSRLPQPLCKIFAHERTRHYSYKADGSTGVHSSDCRQIASLQFCFHSYRSPWDTTGRWAQLRTFLTYAPYHGR
jgi:hypothetical protein